MRSDKEILNLIITKAKEDNRILAAYLKGSRTNPKVPKDIYQDFDIMYVVKETKSFIMDTTWLNTFGTIILKQEQNTDFGYGDRFGLRNHFDQIYSWLLMFDDGNRIDIGVETLDYMQLGYSRNRLFLPLLDKINCLPQSDSPSDADFHIKPPTENQFHGCINEFFWSLCDVIKGIARDELPFVMTTYSSLTHRMLEQMLEWYIGCNTDFSISCGKLNKYFKQYLPQELYNLFLHTYPDGSYEHIWNSIANACELFHRTGIYVAEHFHYEYQQKDEDGFFRYMQIIKSTL